MSVLSKYPVTFGWGLVGGMTMAISLVLLLTVFAWFAPVDAWAEL